MKLAVVGVGSAGSRIVNQILAHEKASGRDLCDGNSLLITSSAPAFDATEHVPQERRLTIGDVYWKVDSANIDSDPDLAAEVAREEQNEIVRAFDLIEFHEVDGILVVAGLAGGTGGGAGAVVIEQLQEICDEPVYAVGVLPSESEGQRSALTAARALQSFVEKADNVIAFDNDAWLGDAPPAVESAEVSAAQSTDAVDDEAASVEADATDEEAGSADADATDGEDDPVSSDATGEEAPPDRTDPETYAHANDVLAERLVTLFAAGEFDGGPISENRLDPSDIIQALDTGGISTIGYASTDIQRSGGIRSVLRALADRLPWSTDEEGEEETAAAKINRLVRQAAQSKLTLPCSVSSADRALIILSGPTRTLSRKGFESGRYWLENEADIVDVKAGDEPHDRATTLTAVVLYSNVTDVPRIDDVQTMALGQTQSPSGEETRSDTAKPP